jgi:hypothetical protein
MKNHNSLATEYRFDEKASIRTPKAQLMNSMTSMKDTPYYQDDKGDSAMMISEFASAKKVDSNLNESQKSKSTLAFSPRHGEQPGLRISPQNDVSLSKSDDF